MTRNLHFFLLAFVLLGWTKVLAQDSVMRAGEPEPQITITYDKLPGGRVQLNLVAEGEFYIDGIQEQAEPGNNFYTLTDSTIKICGTITELTAIYSSITAVDVSLMPSLRLLDIFGNPIESIDLSKSVNLKQLLLGGSSLTNVDLSACALLEFLNINNSTVESLNLANCGMLNTILARGSKVKIWDLSGAVGLEVLDCSFVGLESINLDKAPRLNQLACAGNNLTVLDLSKCPNLLVLNCNANQLSSLDLTQLPLLEELGCSNNQLTSLDCSMCPKLFGMIINSNQIGHKKMSQLVDGLPAVADQPGYLVVIDQQDTNEKNVCTKSNVDKAVAKNWDVLDYDGGSNYEGFGIPYAGSPDDEVSISAYELNDFVVYPTMAEDVVYVDGAVKGEEICLYDFNGRKVRMVSAQGQPSALPVTDLERGIYLLSVGGKTVRIVLK